MDTSEFANLLEKLIRQIIAHERAHSALNFDQLQQQIQLTKDRIQEMVDSR